MAIDIRYAAFNDYSRISEFLDRHWAKNYIYVRGPKLFEWTFNRRDLWDREGFSFALMEDDGAIVGILGAIPFVFNYLGKSSLAVWFANYMLHPDYRKGPLALRLLRAFDRPPFRVQVVFGMNPRVAPIYQRMGWKLVNAIPRHFVVFPEAVERARALIRLAHPQWTLDRAQALVKCFEIRDIPPIQECYESAVPPTWDKVDWPKIASRTAGAARDWSYLTWRYFNHPCFGYHWVAIPDADHTGIAVWRVETIRCTTASGSEEIDKIGRLVEFLPASLENARDLLAVCWNQLMQAGALGADFYGYHVEHQAWLNELGFQHVEKHADGLMIPSRFQPLEPRSATILSAVFAHDEVPFCPGESHAVWYWTKSDADQDRPN
jgi:hypothetical protein